MTNQMIGVSSVFVVTLFLFVLRYCLLMLGRARRNGYATPTLPGAIIEPDAKPVEDDAWLLWTPDEGPRGGSPKRAGRVTRSSVKFRAPGH